MPPRNVNVLQGGFVPGLQTRTSTQQQQQQQQSMVPNPSPGFIQQQRNQSNFPFGGIGQQTPSQQQQQHQPTTPLQQHSNAPQQSQQSNGASTVLLPHLTQSTTTPSLTGTTSSTSEVGLDPNDFPALGSSAPTNAPNNGSAGATASYASQAGTAVPPGTGTTGGGAGATGGAGNGNQARDFTPDDFPALGGQAQTSTQNQDHSHPPGLNGFQHTDQQHRQNLLGSIQPGTPGMLNIGAQARSVHPGFQQQTQTEADKQRVSFDTLFFHANTPLFCHNSPRIFYGGRFCVYLWSCLTFVISWAFQSRTIIL
jgi:CCR4-NOT transcription complex subunit 2